MGLYTKLRLLILEDKIKNMLYFRYRQASLYRHVRSLEHINRCYSTEPLPLPNEPLKTYSPKIQKIVDDISGLTLIEVADLNELLKVCL